MRIIDLSVLIHNKMEIYPGDPQVSIEVVHNYESKGWLLRELVIGSHTGTHVDAFSHMDPRGSTLDEIPLERFCGMAYVVNQGDALPENAGLIFKNNADIDCLHQILNARPPFVGGDLTEKLERALLQHEIITYTNLVNLDSLPAGRPFLFCGFPLRIKDGDGSPVRAVAIFD